MDAWWSTPLGVGISQVVYAIMKPRVASPQIHAGRRRPETRV